MAWSLEGTYIETCSCETPCPCSVSFALGADAVDMSVEDVVPFGAENGEPAQLTNIRHLAGSTLTISKPTHAKVDAFGIVYDGHSGFSKSDFAWSG
jgi:hypothetical protein